MPLYEVFQVFKGVYSHRRIILASYKESSAGVLNENTGLVLSDKRNQYAALYMLYSVALSY